MKRVIIFVTALLLFALSSAGVCADEKQPVQGSALKDGAYEIEVTSSSSMFRIVHCELDVSDGDMSAVMTLSGTGYEKLYMGTGEEALKAGEDDYIYFEEAPSGEYTYTVPVEALDEDIDCAAFSIRKQQWYDRTLVFESSSLPKEAFASHVNPLAIIIPAALIIAAAAIAFLLKKKKSA